MLQRAASNAYSWWWASHIRTKQSKWLEQNLQDMEEKVQDVLKLIEEDGDSFAKRAEMYYKKRPELISFVEESYRAYRSLAERYDHISTELQNANNTIASVFPEQVQFSMDEEDEKALNGGPKKASAAMPTTNVPMAPKGPMKDFKRVVTMEKPGKSLIRKKTMRKSSGGGFTTNEAKSGLSKPEALEEIDKLQKHILALQTEKEFVKSSYENGVAKYWEIENQINEMQEKVSSLQDEFGEGMVIEDSEARNLMAEAALKSCQEKLAHLQEKQERSTEEAMLESQRIKDVRDKLECLKAENEEHDEKTHDDELIGEDREVASSQNEREELESLREKIKQQFEVKSSSPSSFTVTQMVEKIDELVNKVISLETAVSSQAALVERLKSETDELQAQVRSLEVDKAALVADGKSNLSNKLKEMNQKLDGIQVLNKSFKDQNNNLQMHFTEANCNLDHLSDKLQCVKSDEEEIGIAGSSETGLGFNGGLDLITQLEAQPDIVNPFVYNPNNTNPFEDFGIVDSEAKAVVDTFDFDQPQDFSQNLVDVDHKQTHPTFDSEATAELGTFGFDQQQDFSHTLVDLERKLDSEETTVVGTFDFDQRQDFDQNLVNVDRKQTHPVTDSEATTVLDTGDFDPRQEFSEKQVDVNHKPQDFSPEPIDVAHKQTPPQDLIYAQPREDEPDWQKLFTDGMENREKVLLSEYTSTLRNYKDVKKRLGEAEKKNQDSFYDTVQKLKAMKSMNVKKDEEIRTLRLKLGLLEDSLNAENNEEEDIDVILSDKEPTMSAMEEKFRTGIDELLEQNLNFWLRFSSIFHQIQKFDTEVDDLKSEIKRLEEKRNSDQDKSNSLMNLFKSDARPLYKHLREIQTELAVWLEKSALLQEELQCRFSSLCDIQEEITVALKASAEGEDFKFTSYQAAKFQGEVLNMKQENNKVADELQAGLDHVTAMQIDIERTLVRLNEEFQLSGGSKKRTTKNKEGQSDRNSSNDDQPRFRETMNRARIPLRSFIFGVRSKKQKPSIFASVAPSMTKKYQGLKSGLIFRVGE